MADVPEVFTAMCNLCAWSHVWQNRVDAENAAVWHVFDDHPVEWAEHTAWRQYLERQRGGYQPPPGVDDDKPRVPRPKVAY